MPLHSSSSRGARSSAADQGTKATPQTWNGDSACCDVLTGEEASPARSRGHTMPAGVPRARPAPGVNRPTACQEAGLCPLCDPLGAEPSHSCRDNGRHRSRRGTDQATTDVLNPRTAVAQGTGIERLAIPTARRVGGFWPDGLHVVLNHGAPPLRVCDPATRQDEPLDRRCPFLDWSTPYMGTLGPQNWGVCLLCPYMNHAASRPPTSRHPGFVSKGFVLTRAVRARASKPTSWALETHLASSSACTASQPTRSPVGHRTAMSRSTLEAHHARRVSDGYTPQSGTAHVIDELGKSATEQSRPCERKLGQRTPNSRGGSAPTVGILPVEAEPIME
jgi:hypothetical protein